MTWPYRESPDARQPNALLREFWSARSDLMERPCPRCGAPVGKPCRSAGGNVTSAHVGRRGE